MGWSTSRRAGYTMESIEDFCVQQTGASNTFEVNGTVYFVEYSNREYGDGSATGQVYRVDQGKAYKSTGIRIDGRTGKIVRGPAILKNLPVHVITFIEGDRRIPMLWKGGEITEDNLQTELREYVRQYESGGINHHVSLSMGRIPYPSQVTITDLDDNVILDWKAGKFQVY